MDTAQKLHTKLGQCDFWAPLSKHWAKFIFINFQVSKVKGVVSKFALWTL